MFVLRRSGSEVVGTAHGIGIVLAQNGPCTPTLPADALVRPSKLDERIAFVLGEGVVMVANKAVVQAIDICSSRWRDPADTLPFPTRVEHINCLIAVGGVEVLARVWIVKSVHVASAVCQCRSGR